MTDKSNNLFENLETVKEYRWVLWLAFLIITISKDIIKNTIGLATYNIVITCIMSIFGIYILYQLIEYIKYNNTYNIKNMKKELILSFIMILATVIFLIFLLII
ncbi:hypothetical protein [Terrisporobacter mayombei]|uniref:hypothetical protein n=1 Tax=Terrisporobacter mayombei TaxID=1541 RepID=UPI002659670A|nr:hypothetical protein [Terrisporobacter mayombei]MCC3669356.1 hypothetical protein [Terrisporobacter mayombei]